MLSKLHKTQGLNEIIAQNLSRYIQISEILDIEGQTIVAGSACYTHETSMLIHKIIEPSLKEISHILKDTFYFAEKKKKQKKIKKLELFMELLISKVYTQIFRMI